jgi:hypothetical protein
MQLDSAKIANSFNSAIPSNWFGFSVAKVQEICGIAPSTWRKYHKLLRDAETALLANNKKPFGFTYQLRSQGLDRTSLLLIFSLVYIQKFFNNEKLALKELYKNWEDIKCQANL